MINVVPFLHRLRNCIDSDLFDICIASLLQGLKKKKCAGETETGRERLRMGEKGREIGRYTGRE